MSFRGIVLVLFAVLSTSSAIRKQDKPSAEHERMHIVRRLYGEHASTLRDNVDEVLSRMPRFQTGLPADPNHRIEYEAHPFDPEHRHLQSNATSSLFRPMRIRFETSALDAMTDDTNRAKIAWYKSVILPQTADFWSKALSVVPVSGNLLISSAELDDRSYCGDVEFTEVPVDHISDGLPNTDLVLYVSGTPSQRFCPERTLAVAVPCNFDQYDRPIAGSINVCLDAIELNDDGQATDALEQDYIDVTIHEVGHVLGHSSNSYQFFWDPDTGKPRTDRPFTPRTVTCVNGEQRSLIIPSENTMRFGETANGDLYASIVTPKVRAIARNQFDCQSLEGARLENQPTRETSCAGDHWDERLFYPEALSGVISPTTNILSSLTLALMEDSGWYKANYTMSKMSPWGLGAGCEFVDEKCLVQGANGPEVPEYSRGFFCADADQKGCSSELSHKLSCTVIDYYFYVPQTLPPVSDQFYPNEPSKGGPRQADYCPVFGSTYANKEAYELACVDPANSGNGFNLHKYVLSSTLQPHPSFSDLSLQRGVWPGEQVYPIVVRRRALLSDRLYS